MPAIVWIMLLTAVLIGGYGLLNLLFPHVTIRWRQRSTQRSEERGDAVGAAVGGFFGDLVEAGEDLATPRTRAHRRVRWIGVAEVAVAAVLTGLALFVAGS